MNKTEIKTLQRLSKATSCIPKSLDAGEFIQSILKQTIDITRSELACFYRQYDFHDRYSHLKIKYKIGRHETPRIIQSGSDFINFVYECNDVVILLERKKSPFIDMLLNGFMNSGICFPVSNKNLHLGIVFLNSTSPNFYNREKTLLVDSLYKLIQSTLNNLKIEHKKA